MNDNSKTTELFKGLKALSDASFPKRCANCGAEYESVKDYVQKTQDVSGQSGLKKGYDDDGKPIVELFRNCVCGSTLMDCFNDRRQATEAGIKRRMLFDKLLKDLQQEGLKASSAREQLLKVLRGEHSEVLTRIGINTQIR
jgi:hypothetical protein